MMINDSFTDKEKTDIDNAVMFLEKENHKKAKEVLDVIALYEALLEEKDMKIHEYDEDLAECKGYIEDWN